MNYDRRTFSLSVDCLQGRTGGCGNLSVRLDGQDGGDRRPDRQDGRSDFSGAILQCVCVCVKLCETLEKENPPLTANFQEMDGNGDGLVRGIIVIFLMLIITTTTTTA